jgi:hypothetical protein
MHRREFLSAGVAVSLNAGSFADALAFASSHRGTPQETKDDEHFWFQIQRAFTVDRSIINLNSGGVSPSPAVVHDALKRHLDLSNSGPSYFMWRVQEPQRETVRGRLARLFGADPRRSRSPATPPRDSRPASSASTSSPATKSSAPTRTTAG